MNNVSAAVALTNDSIFEDDIDASFSVDDDVDALFSRLEKFTPPANLVANIMSAVARLPYQYLQETEVAEASKIVELTNVEIASVAL